MAQPTRCVYEILFLPCSVRKSLIIRRFSSITLTGITRWEVATGIDRLARMLSAMRAAAPRNGTSCSPGPTGKGGGALRLTAAPLETAVPAAGAAASGAAAVVAEGGGAEGCTGAVSIGRASATEAAAGEIAAATVGGPASISVAVTSALGSMLAFGWPLAVSKISFQLSSTMCWSLRYS